MWAFPRQESGIYKLNVQTTRLPSWEDTTSGILHRCRFSQSHFPNQTGQKAYDKHVTLQRRQNNCYFDLTILHLSYHMQQALVTLKILGSLMNTKPHKQTGLKTMTPGSRIASSQALEYCTKLTSTLDCLMIGQLHFYLNWYWAY